MKLPVDFDPGKHLYSLQGQPFAGTTDVLRDLGLYPYYPDAGEYRDRGTAVHKCCELLAADKLQVEQDLVMVNGGQKVGWSFPGTDPRLSGYLTAFCRFIEMYGRPQVILSEQLLYDRRARKAGTLDFLFWIRSLGFCIVDLKTGAAPRCVAIQLAGYSRLLSATLSQHPELVPDRSFGETTAARRFSLQLKPEGKFVFEEHSSSNDLAIWQSSCNVWDWRRDNGLIKPKGATA